MSKDKITVNSKQNEKLYHRDTPYTDNRLPIADIWDEPYQYHRINKAWRAIIFGWIHILASVRGFLDANEEDHRGIQQVLKFLEPVPVSLVKYPLSAFGDCVEYGTLNDATSFMPNNPFAPGDAYDKSLIELKWMRFSDIITFDVLPGWLQSAIDFLGDKAGYLDNDIFLVLDGRDDFGFNNQTDIINAILNLNILPSITVNLSGAGIVQLMFLNVPLGCSVLIYWDIEPTIQQVWDVAFGGEFLTNFTLIELNRDLIAIPPETISRKIVEVIFDEPGLHEIKCIFIPTFNDELPFVFPFGGFRELQVCDGIEVIGVSTGAITAPDKFRSEIMVTTIEEMCEAVKCGNIAFLEEIAQRILLASDPANVENDVIIGALGDGGGFETIIESVSGLPIPEFNTTASEGRNGGAYNQAVQFAKLFTDTNSQITSGFSQNLIVKSLQYIMYSPALIYFSISDYVLTAVPVVIDIPKLAESIFCTGSFSNGLFEYASDPANHIETDFGYILDMAQDLSNSVISEWYADGKTSPRTDYQGYVCFRFPTKSLPGITYDVVSTANHPLLAFNDPTSYPTRTVRLEITGKITSNEGAEFDGMYGKDNAGVVTYNAPQIDSTTNTTPLNAPVYNPNGGYAVEYQVSGIMVSFIIARFAWNNLVGNTGITGELTVVVYDLGVQ